MLTILKIAFGVFIIVAALAILALAVIFAISLPSMFVNFCKPALRYLYIAVDFVLAPIRFLKIGLSKLWCKIRKTDYYDDPPEREFGIYNVIFILFCIVFSAVVIIWVIKTGRMEAGLVEGSFLESLPIYAIINMIINGAITYEGLVQLALFNILSICLMEKNRFDGKPFLNVLFDLIFTVFCTSFLYVIPDKVYEIPGDVVGFLASLFEFDGNNVVLIVLTTLAVGVVYLIAMYFYVATYAVAIREMIVSIVYSLIPLIGVLIMVVVFTNKSWDPIIINTCCYAVTIISTVIVSYMRFVSEGELMEELTGAHETLINR